jgi:hypothetical protein
VLLLGFVLSDDVDSGDVTSICWDWLSSLDMFVSSAGVSLADRRFSVSAESGGIIFDCIFFCFGSWAADAGDFFIGIVFRHFEKRIIV